MKPIVALTFRISIVIGLTESPTVFPQENRGTAAPPAANGAITGKDAAPAKFLVGPTSAGSQAVRTVSLMLPKYHLSRRTLDDDMARRWLGNYLKVLDAKKSYFDQADVDGFLKRQYELAALAKQGDLSFAYEIFQVFHRRVTERTKLVLELLREPVDFARDEEMVTDFDMLNYAHGRAEAREIWRKQIKYDLLRKKLNGVPLEEARQQLSRRYDHFRRNLIRFDDEDLLEAYLTAEARAYDAGSAYISTKKLDEAATSTTQQLEGLGIQMVTIDDETVLARIVPGGPAAKDGRLKVGDRLLAVGQGADGVLLDIDDLSARDVAKLTRGQSGTVCRVQVIHKAQGDRELLSLVRGRVQMQQVRARVVERVPKSDSTPLRVGYIHVPSFYATVSSAAVAKTTTGDVREILDGSKRSFRSGGVEVVILDLRSSYGGVLREVISFSGLFLGSGPVAQAKGADGDIQHFDCDEILTAWGGPLIVLTSRNTAAGAELVVAALKDYGRALIIGDPATLGNGTIQSTYQVGAEIATGANPPKLGSLTVTIRQFYRVNGDSTQLRGLVPDVILPSPTGIIPGRDVSAPALPFDSVAPIKHANLEKLSTEQKGRLRGLSAQRVNNSEDFRGLLERLSTLEARNLKKTVSLQEDVARKCGNLADTSADSAFDGELFEPGFYNDEVLAIARDYVQALKAEN